MSLVAMAAARSLSPPMASSSSSVLCFVQQSRNGRASLRSARATRKLLRAMAASNDKKAAAAARTKQAAGGYVGKFVKKLGMDSAMEEREEAVDALWRHSQGGKDNIDEMIKFPQCLELVASLVSSESWEVSEAAAGVLRQVASVESHRSLVADAGAIQEIVGLLTRRAAPVEVRVQALFALWNLSFEEAYRTRIASVELLCVLMAALESDDGEEQEAAAGLLSNLALSRGLHVMLAEASVVPKLAKLLKDDLQKGTKAARQEARSALLALSQTPQAKAAVMEHGLMFVPVIGAEAYKSLKPLLPVHDPPSAIPENNDNLELLLQQLLHHPLVGSQQQQQQQHTDLLGLTIGEAAAHGVDEATQMAIEGRNRLKFLMRLGLLGRELSNSSSKVQEEQQQSVMPWWDALPRLVLILGGLEAAHAAKGAAAVADAAATSERARLALAKAGCIPHLVRLLGSGHQSAMESAALALDKLSLSSHEVRSAINSFGAVPALVAILNAEDSTPSLQDKALGALLSLSQTQQEVEATVQCGIAELARSGNVADETKVEAEQVLRELSSPKVDARDTLAACGGIPALVRCLASSPSTSCREKSAVVLANVASKEQLALSVAEADVDAALKSLFEQQGDTGLTVVATSLLRKLLSCGGARELLDLDYYALHLSSLLQSQSTPVFAKDCASACLLELMTKGEQ